MTVRQTGFELTPGAAVTAAANGGDAFTSLSAGAGSSWVADTGQVAHGVTAGKVTPAASAATFAAWGGMSSAGAAFRGMFLFTGLATSDTYLIDLYQGGNRRAGLYLMSTGRFRVRSNTVTNLWTSTDPCPLWQWLRLELRCAPGTSSTDGVIETAISFGDNRTPFASWSSTTVDTGTSPLTNVNVGKVNASDFASPFWTDDFAVDDAATALLGPVPWTPSRRSRLARLPSRIG